MNYDGTHETLTPLCNASPPPRQASDFTHLSKPGQICHLCSQHGVILAYDIYAPMIGMWICGYHWEALQWPLPANFLVVVEDKREKETTNEH